MRRTEGQSRYRDFFARNGYTLLCAGTAKAALDLLNTETIEIVLIVFRKPPTISAPLTRLLIDIKDFDQRIEVLLVAPRFSEDFAVKAVQLGAADCISKPDDLYAILESLNTVTEHITLRKQTGLLEREIRERYTFQGMISKNLYMLEIFTLIQAFSKALYHNIYYRRNGHG